jgi:hypothetical protein
MKPSPTLLARFAVSPLLNVFLFIIVVLHALFLLVLLISPTFVFHKKQHKPLIVKTVVPKPLAKTVTLEKKNPCQNSASAASPSPKPVQKTAPIPKQQQMTKAQTPPKKGESSKTTAQKSASSVKKEPAIADKQISKIKQPAAQKDPPPQNRAKISDSLMKELEESIAKIENKSDKGASKKTPLSRKTLAPIALQIDTPSHALLNEAEGSGDYIAVLVGHLHQCLSLPDYGEVKIQLSLLQDGTVCKVIVLKAQSEKNKQYLESSLPQLKFPRFDGAYAGKTEWTFVLTFCNE